MRGEYPKIRVLCGLGTGSPPLARGILQCVNIVVVSPGITPACAGNTSVLACRSANARDHPRLRGEYSRHQKPWKNLLGSPPLARGIPWRFAVTKISPGITPACAGNTFAMSPCMASFPGSPPLARGIHHLYGFQRLATRITPACAGNTDGVC